MLFCEEQEEPEVVDKIPTEQASRFVYKSIEPFHTHMLNPEGSTALHFCLEIDSGTKSHENLDVGHPFLPFHDVFFLFGRSHANNQDVGTTCIDLVDDMLTFLGLLVEPHARRECANDDVAPYLGVDAFFCLLGHIVQRTKKEDAAIGVVAVILTSRQASRLP